MELSFLSVVIATVLLMSVFPSKAVEIGDVLSCPENPCCSNLRTDTLPNLDIAFNCSHPDNVTIILPPGTNRTTGFRLFHSHLCVTRLPQNICDFPNIASIRFDYSFLTSIPSFSCLKNLIALDLSNNRIGGLKMDTFLGLSRLRYINLQFNRISYIEPHTFKEDLHGLMFVLLDYNLLTTSEAWPMRIKHPFCRFGLSNNLINRLSNEENWRVNLSETYGPGTIDFSNNQFTVWITEYIEIYGFDDLTTLGLLLSWGIDLRGNPWVCDCKLHRFLKLSSNFDYFVKRNYFAVLCQSPSSLKGIEILHVPLTSFVCNITEKCPSWCLCQDQPENKRMFVDCRNGNLTSLPLHLPDGYLHLLLSNNSITSLDGRYYLARTRHIDLSYNRIVTVAVEAIDNLQHEVELINLSHNLIVHLPKRIQKIQLSKLNLTNNLFICSCKYEWMYNWLRLSSKDNSNIECEIPSGSQVPVLRAADIYKDCRSNLASTVTSIILGVLAIVFITFVILSVVFRYEVMVLIHTTPKRSMKSNEGRVCDYDVFLSVDEDCDQDRKWASLTVLPELERNHGLRVYYPPRDMIPGSVTVQELINAFRKSSTALVIVSDSYATNPTMMFQFMEAYNIVVRQRRGRIILVRFTEVKKVSNRYLQAFLRLGKFMEKDNEELFLKIAAKVKQ